MPQKRSNPKRNVPRKPKQFVSGEGIMGEKSRTDFAQSTSRRYKRLAVASGGTMPVSESAPRPPPVLVLYEDMVDELGPAPVYGQYPRGFIEKILPWLRCDRHKILHVCSGSLPKGEGIRVDIRPEAMPDILADGRDMHMIESGTIDAVLMDPPYNQDYAKSLYGVAYPRPSHLLLEAARVVKPGGRIALVHYITAKPVPGTRFVKAFGLSTGFDMPMRAVAIYERDQPSLDMVLDYGHDVKIREHDRKACKVRKCSTTHEVVCSCGWAQSCASVFEARVLRMGHMHAPSAQVISFEDGSAVG